MPVFDTIRLEPSTGGVIAIPQESVQTSSEEAFRRLTFNGTEIVFVSGRNLGSGAKVFTGTNGSSDLILDFKSVRGGLGIAIEEDANHITITATGETAPFFPAVDEGVYTAPVITFDDQGRITSVVNGIAGGSTTASNLGGVGSIPVFVQKTGLDLRFRSLRASGIITLSSSGTEIQIGANAVTSVAAIGTGPITVTGGPVTSTGIFTIGIADSGVNAGVYANPTITVDAKGRVVAAAAGTSVTSVNAVGSGPITVTGGPVTSTGTFTISLADSGVAAGVYANAKVTVDAKGRVTGIESAPAVTSVGTAPVTVSSNPATGIFTIGIADSGVNAGVYANPTITIDSKGRVVAAAAGTAVSSVNAVGTGPITVTGGPVTSTGTFTISLADSGAVAGQYTNPTVTIDAKGRVTGIETTPAVTSVGAAPVTVSNNPATGTFTIGIADSGVNAGVYANPTITVDAKGRVTAAAAGTAVLSVNAVGTGPITVTGGPVTSTGTFTISLADSGVAAGVYANPTITVDAKGRLTEVEAGTPVTSVGTAPITVASDPATGIFTIGIADSGVDAGVYTNPTITIDSKGRVVAAAAGTAVSSVNAVGTGPITVTGGPVTSTGTFTIGIADSGVDAGVYTNPTITVDSKGRVVAAAAGTAVSSVNAVGTGPITVTGGPVTSTGTFTISLADSGAVAGQYTNPTVTVDAKGRVTAISPGNAVTSVAATGQNGIVVSGSPITSSGTLQVSLGNTGVVAGTYQAASVTVNAQGRITAIAANDLGEANTGTNIGAGRNVFASKQGTALQFRTLRASTNIVLTETATEIEIAALPNEEVVVLRYTEAGDFDGGDIIVSETENVAATIINAATGVVRFSFTGKTRPPSSIAVLGQDYASNNFVYQQATPAMNIIFAGGGTSEDPLLTSAITTADITLSQAVTGATSDSQERSRLVVIFKW
jgi:fibronectin-binding autotransporter adhesin